METIELTAEPGYQELKNAYCRLEKKNKDIVDGFYYAAYVQQGLMPQPRHFRKLQKPYFIYYHPLNIIGGDFFWIGRKEEWMLFAVGDCTGHGISGAMLSTLAIGFLNYVVYSKTFKSTGEIVQELDKKWIETFNHHEEENVNNDWMEISLIAYNSSTKEIQYSGAASKAFMVCEDKALELRGDFYPVGGWQLEPDRKYHTQRLRYQEAMKFYLYSDGFKDQFGEATGKRYGSKRFKEVISLTSSLSVSCQKAALEQEFTRWKGGTEQTDDVCLLRMDL